MSIFLALDGGGDVFSAALNLDGDIYRRAARADADATHSTLALPLITALLADHQLTLGDCNAFAFAAGPGKFSALRFVCALARTFAYADNKPLIAVPSFIALAEANVPAAVHAIKCALPAQRGHAYFAVCRRATGGGDSRRQGW